MPRMRRSKHRYVNPQVLYAIIVALVGIGIVVGLQTPQWKNFVASYQEQPAEEETENPDNEDLEIDDFDLFLKEATIQQLIFRSSELVDDPQKDVLDRLQQQQQRIRIAERLLSEKANGRANELGTIAKLTALQAREWLNFDYGFTDPEQLDELLDFSVMNAASDNDRIKQKAQQGRLSARIIQYLRSGDDEDSASYQPVLKEFQTMCDQNVEESDVASDLFGYLQRIHLHTQPGIFEEFAEAFKAAYGNSDNEQVRKIAEEVKIRIISNEFLLTDVFASTGAQQEASVEQLRSELVNVLQSANISQHGYQKIVAGIGSLARLGYYEGALETSDLLRRRVAGNDLFQQLLEDLSYRRGHWEQVGEPFTYESLATLNGEPFQPRSADLQNQGHPVPHARTDGDCVKSDRLHPWNSQAVRQQRRFPADRGPREFRRRQSEQDGNEQNGQSDSDRGFWFSGSGIGSRQKTAGTTGDQDASPVAVVESG